MFRFLNKISFRNKMILIFLTCVLLPVVIQNYYFYSHTEKNIQDEMIQRLNATLDSKAEQIKGNIAGTISLSRKYDKNEQLSYALDHNYGSFAAFFAAYNELKPAIVTDLAYLLQVKEVMFYTNNPTIINGSYIRQLVPFEYEDFGEKLLTVSESDCGEVRYRVSNFTNELRETKERAISVIRPMNYFSEYASYEKVIRIDLNLQYLNSILRESGLFDNIILADQEGRILLSTNTYKTEGEYEIFQPKKLKSSIIVLKRDLQDTPFTIYGLYDSKVISKQFSQYRGKTFLIAIGGLLFATVAIVIVTQNVTSRMNRVVYVSEQIAKGNFIQLKDKVDGIDEISVLEHSVNLMSEQLANLIEKEYHGKLLQAKLERENAQAKLLALQSQVNPHFMFNALESIRLKAMAKKEAETAGMIKYMSRMFRRLINWDEDIIALKEEIQFLEEYLSIQKYRFEDEFSYEVSVEASVNMCLLPKMVIQPLVENACVHGVEAIANYRHVAVTAGVFEENWLQIQVKDNGGGIKPERLAQIQQMLHQKGKLGTSVGLQNIYQRLVLNYGEQFVFEIESTFEVGTVCTIRIPIQKQEV